MKVLKGNRRIFFSKTTNNLTVESIRENFQRYKNHKQTLTDISALLDKPTINNLTEINAVTLICLAMNCANKLTRLSIKNNSPSIEAHTQLKTTIGKCEEWSEKLNLKENPYILLSLYGVQVNLFIYEAKNPGLFTRKTQWSQYNIENLREIKKNIELLRSTNTYRNDNSFRDLVIKHLQAIERVTSQLQTIRKKNIKY